MPRKHLPKAPTGPDAFFLAAYDLGQRSVPLFQRSADHFPEIGVLQRPSKSNGEVTMLHETVNNSGASLYLIQAILYLACSFLVRRAGEDTLSKCYLGSAVVHVLMYLHHAAKCG